MNGLMEELFETVTKSVDVPLDRLTQAERTRIIAQLHEQGMFELRGAVQFTVKKLSCSQASIYRYIKSKGRRRTAARMSFTCPAVIPFFSNEIAPDGLLYVRGRALFEFPFFQLACQFVQSLITVVTGLADFPFC